MPPHGEQVAQTDGIRPWRHGLATSASRLRVCSLDVLKSVRGGPWDCPEGLGQVLVDCSRFCFRSPRISALLGVGRNLLWHRTKYVLIPIEVAHQNEMMPPTVTE
jgi:hypothetical protein